MLVSRTCETQAQMLCNRSEVANYLPLTGAYHAACSSWSASVVKALMCSKAWWWEQRAFMVACTTSATLLRDSSCSAAWHGVKHNIPLLSEEDTTA